MNYFIYCLKNYFNFSGRATRSEFWYFTLFVLLFGKICYSQSENAVSEKLFKINILTPGLNYESKIGNKKTLNLF